MEHVAMVTVCLGNNVMYTELTSEIHHLRDLLTMQGGEAELVEIKNLREQLLESEKLMSEATRYHI